MLISGVLELRSVRPGETVIKGVSSSLYLCVDNSGHLRGQQQYKQADCTFRELLLSDGYTVFQSPHNGLPISLSSKPSGVKYARPFYQFLPVMNELILGMERVKKEKGKLSERQENVDLESDDPLGMRISAADVWSSPGFHSR
ncbi:fibroblast growth factor 19-like isoform X1 [Anguilla anguilla]|uniref:fibroblast growth factor 19-like isoform X1 n=1 Tax=Anguilla anguilla TaxID=7936 RepID=UPI0015B000D3|nr:fibroblast growth factor 19-like isoform X1 [Anguilla anguilla]